MLPLNAPDKNPKHIRAREETEKFFAFVRVKVRGTGTINWHVRALEKGKCAHTLYGKAANCVGGATREFNTCALDVRVLKVSE